MKKIVVRNLYYKYFNSDFTLKKINLEIDSGEFVLVTGPSGSGKSTLAYCLSGIIPHCMKNGEMKGEVLIDGKDTRNFSLNELTKKVGIILQNPESQIFGTSVEEDIAFGLENLSLPPQVISKKVDEILDFVGLKKLREKEPECLSGGQKQRLVIGSILAMEPDVLILDEPVSNLDPLGTKLVLSTLISLKKSKTIILIERKSEQVIPFVDKVIAIDNGAIVAKKSPKELFKDRVLIERLGINPPQVVRLAYKLEELGVRFKDLPLTVEEFLSGFNATNYKDQRPLV
jgi:energy-coupling factor transporter ATP-binding protein EcfA2